MKGIIAIHKTTDAEKKFTSINTLLKFLKTHKSYGGCYRHSGGFLQIIRQFPKI